jgi:hypothetical protein
MSAKQPLGSGNHCISHLQLCDGAPINAKCHDDDNVYIDLGIWPAQVSLTISLDHARSLRDQLDKILADHPVGFVDSKPAGYISKGSGA